MEQTLGVFEFQHPQIYIHDYLGLPGVCVILSGNGGSLALCK